MPWRQRGVEVQIHTFLTLTLDAVDWLAKRLCRVNTSKGAGCAPEPENNVFPPQGSEPGVVQREHRLLSCLRTRYIYCECRIADRTDSSGSVCGCWWMCTRVSLSSKNGASSGSGLRNGLQYGGKLRMYWIRNRGQPKRGGPPSRVLCELLRTQ